MKSKCTSGRPKLGRATLQAMRQQAMIAAVSARGELRVMVHDDAVTAAGFREFLSRLMLGARQPVVLVLDGHPIHKARLVRYFVAAPKGHLKLFCLPPYSPHLNPDEQVWAHAKHIFSKRLVQSEDEMQWPAIASLDRIQKLPALAKPFFRQPECNMPPCDIYFGNISNRCVNWVVL
ncbi:transposase [Burkholderia ubonensis]|uniref:transposase n=1 Tax=Burkholderia ubonensis TaxID=101571 RepID=UPI000A9963A2|nr:transposase [Burkholderia ubonensis]